MPELPEVHTTATDLNELLKGKKILDVWTNYNSPFYKNKPQIKNPTYFKLFKKEIVSETVTSASRVAKNVLIHLTNDKTILVHMKMTGHLLYGKYKKTGAEWKPDQKGALNDMWNGWIRLVFTLSNGKHLALSDLRKFAKVTLLQTSNLHESDDLQNIGPDPLEKSFTKKVFVERIMMRPKGKIKTVLMDQSLIAGIGNIYSDEALWLSTINPETLVADIPVAKHATLLKNIKHVLSKGIDFKGDSMSDYRRPNGEPGDFQNHHNVYQRKGKTCNRRGCAGIITRKVVNGRSAHYCDTCQK